MLALRPYQENMVQYLKTTPQAALYVSMRLGKTIATIRAFKNLPERKLVVCPKTVIPVWCDELEQEGIQSYTWLSSDWVKNIAYFVQGGGMLPEWTIINYEGIQRLPEKLIKLFPIVVLDESVRIASPQSKVTKFFNQNFIHAKRKVLLSGNPAPNSELQYFPQMKFLHGEWLGCENFWQFRHKYFASDLTGWQWWARSSSKEVIRLELQKKAFVLSRKDVGIEERKVYEKRYVEMPKSLEKEYKKMEKEFVLNLPDGQKLETSYILAQLSYLQQMAGGSCSKQKFSDFKIRELLNLLEGDLKGEQVIVWCKFRWELSEIARELTDKKIKFGLINGDTPTEDRKDLQQKFQKKELTVLLIQIQTGRYGINLSSSSTAIYYSNSYSWDERSQSEDRILSVEKKEPLLYVDLLTRGTVDEEILKALNAKKKNTNFYMNLIDGLRRKYV